MRRSAAVARQALKFEPGTHVVSSGALATTSGEKTGRSPKDKRVVREDEFEKVRQASATAAAAGQG